VGLQGFRRAASRTSLSGGMKQRCDRARDGAGPAGVVMDEPFPPWTADSIIMTMGHEGGRTAHLVERRAKTVVFSPHLTEAVYSPTRGGGVSSRLRRSSTHSRSEMPSGEPTRMMATDTFGKAAAGRADRQRRSESPRATCHEAAIAVRPVSWDADGPAARALRS